MGRLANQTIFLTLEKVAHLGGGLVLLVAVARLLGQSALADYAFAIAATAVFVPFLDAGLNNRAINSVSQYDDWQAVSDAVAFRLKVSPWLLVAMVILAWISGKSWDVVLAVVFIGISTLAMSLGDALNAGFKGRLEAQYSAFWVGITNVGLVGLSIWSMLTGGDVVGIAVMYMVCRIGYCMGSGLVVKRLVSGLRFLPLATCGRDTLVQSIGFLPAVFFIGCLLHLNFLTADWLDDGRRSGFYAIGYRMASALYVLGGASLEALLALFSQKSQPDENLWRKGWVLFGVGILGVLLVEGLAEPITVWILGEAFLAAVVPVRLLAWTLPPFLLCGFFHTVLLGRGQAQKAIHLMFALLIAGVILGGVGFVFGGAAGTALSPTVTGWTLAGVLGWTVKVTVKKG